MTHHITAQLHDTFYQILYRNSNIITITRFDPDLNPRGQDVPYDELSLSEREAVLIAIINHLNNATQP